MWSGQITALYLMFSFGEKDILTTQPYFKELYQSYCNSLSSTQLITKTSNSSTLHFPETPLFLTALEHHNESMMVYALKHVTDGMNKGYVDYKTFHQNVWDKSKSPFEIKQTLLSNCLNNLDHPLHTIPKTTRLLGLLFELAIEFKVEDYLQSCLTSLPISDTYSTPQLASESNPLFDENTYLFSPLLVSARAGRLDIMQALIDLGHPMGYERIKLFSLENTATLNNHCYYEPQSSSTYLVKHLLTIAFDSVDSDRLNDFYTFLSHQQNKLTQEDTTYITRSIFLSLACKSHNATKFLNGEAEALAVETLDNHERFLSKFEPQILAQTILDIRKYMLEKDISLLLISFSSSLNTLIQQDISIDLDPTYCDRFSSTLVDTALYTHGFNDSLLYSTPNDKNYTQTENNRLYFIFFLDHVWPLCSENTKQMILTSLDQTTETRQEQEFKQSIKRCLSDELIDHETDSHQSPLELTPNPLTKKLNVSFPILFENHLRYCNDAQTLERFMSYLENPSQKPLSLLRKIVPSTIKSNKLNDKETSRLKELGFMKQFFQHLYDIKH